MNDLNEEKQAEQLITREEILDEEDFRNSSRDGKKRIKERTKKQKAKISFAEQLDQNLILPQDIQSETSASTSEIPETTQELQEPKDETEEITIKPMDFNELTKTACGNGEMIILGKNSSTLRVSYNREQSRYFLNGEKTEKNILEIRLDELAEKDGEFFQVLYEDARMIPEDIDFKLGEIRKEITEIEVPQEPAKTDQDTKCQIPDTNESQTPDASKTTTNTTAAECTQLEEKVARGALRAKKLSDFSQDKIDSVMDQEKRIRYFLGKKLDEFIQKSKNNGEFFDSEKTRENWAQIIAQNLGLENSKELENILSALDDSRWYKFDEISWKDIELMTLTTVRAFLRYSGIKDESNVFDWAKELKKLASNENYSKEKLSAIIKEERGIEILTK